MNIIDAVSCMCDLAKGEAEQFDVIASNSHSEGLSVFQADELVAVVVVGEFEPMGGDIRGDGVGLFDEPGDLVGIGREKAADAHETGPEGFVVLHGLVGIAEHEAEIVVGAADFDPLLPRDAAELFVRDGAPGGLGVGIPHFADAAEALADVFPRVHGVPDGKEL